MWNDIEFGFHFAYNLLGPKLFQLQLLQLISQYEQEQVCHDDNNNNHEKLSSSRICTFYWRSTSSSSTSTSVVTPVKEESKISSSLSSSLKDIECIYIDITIEFYILKQQLQQKNNNNNYIQVQIQFGSFWRIVLLQSPSNHIYYIYSITDHAMNKNDDATTTTNTDSQHNVNNKASSVSSTWQQWLYNHIQYSSLQIDIQSTSISILASMIAKTIYNPSQCIQYKQRIIKCNSNNNDNDTNDTNTNNNANPDNTDDTRFNNEYYDILLHYIDFDQYIPFITVQIPITTIISQQQQYEYRYTIPLLYSQQQQQQKLHGSIYYEQAYINYIIPTSIGYRTVLHHRQQQQQQQVYQDMNIDTNTTNQTTNTAKTITTTTIKPTNTNTNTKTNTKTNNNETTMNDDESVLLSIDTLWTMFQDWIKTINEKNQNTNNSDENTNDTTSYDNNVDVDVSVGVPSLATLTQQQQQQQDICKTDVLNQSKKLEATTAIPAPTPTTQAAAAAPPPPTTTTNTTIPNKRRIIVKHKNQFNNVRMVVRKK